MARRRPPRGSLTFACRACRTMVNDGVDHARCPRCSGEVDWVDPRDHVWTCPPCDLVVNRRTSPGDTCPNCSAPLVHISPPLAASDIPARRSLIAQGRRTGAWVLVMLAVFALVRRDRPYLAPVIIVAMLIGIGIIVKRVVGSRELRALAANRSTRIIHGIEHATANVLEERGLEIWRGQTVDGMFWLEIVDARHAEQLETIVKDAAADAISRIQFGDRALAYDPRCDTSALAGAALLCFAIATTAIFAVLAGMFPPLAFALALGAVFVVGLVETRAGLTTQRWFTVSTDFASAVVTRVDKRRSADGTTLTAIVMVDVIPRAVDVDAVAPVPL